MHIPISKRWNDLTFSWISEYINDNQHNTINNGFYKTSKLRNKNINNFTTACRSVLSDDECISFRDTIDIRKIKQKEEKNSKLNLEKLLLTKYSKDIFKCILINIIKTFLLIYLNLKFKYFLKESHSKELFYNGINLVIVNILKISFGIYSNYIISLLSLKIQSNLFSTVFQFILEETSVPGSSQINNIEHEEWEMPNIYNLAFGDLNFCEPFLTALIELVTSPFRIVGAWFLLKGQIGLSANFAIIIYLIITAISIFFQIFGSLKKKHFMKIRDERISKCYSYFSTLNVIRQHFWDEIVYEDLMFIRRKEIRANFTRYIFSLFGTFIEYNTYLISQYTIMCTYIYYQYNTNVKYDIALTSGFSTLHALNILVSPTRNITTSIIEGFISLNRLKNFIEKNNHYNVNLNLNEDCKVSYEQITDDDSLITIKDAVFVWDKYCYYSKYCLHNIESKQYSPAESLIDFSQVSDRKDFKLGIRDISFKKGECYIVTGNYHSGKTAFIKSILGEMVNISGKLLFKNRKEDIKFCFSMQNIWIPSGTIRSSILFGQVYIKEIYDIVITSCALENDLSKWKNGDLRLIDEDDKTLSNGQKSRLRLARTIYLYKILKRKFSDSSEIICLLDDIFAGLDIEVSREIFNNLFGSNGILNDSLCILTCNINSISLIFLEIRFTHSKKLPKVLVLEEGHVVFNGSLNEYVTSINIDSKKERSQTLNDIIISSEMVNLRGKADKINETLENNVPLLHNEIKHFIERKEKEATSFNIYLFYFRKIGIKLTVFFSIACIIKICIGELITLNINTFLSLSRNENDGISKSVTPKNFILYFTVLMIIKLSVDCFTFITEAIITVKASKVIHREYLISLLNVPLSFYSLTPISKILNRFNLDILLIDDVIIRKIAGIIVRFLETFFKLSFTLFLCPIIGIFVDIHLITITFKFGMPLLSVFRDTQDFILGQMTIFSKILSEIKTGKEVIYFFRDSRAMYKNKFNEILGNIVNLKFIQISAIQWSSLRIQLLSGPFITLIYSLFILLSTNFEFISINERTRYSVGLIIYYFITFTETLNIIYLRLSSLEKDMCSIERIKEYSEIAKLNNTVEDVFKNKERSFNCNSKNIQESALFKEFEVESKAESPLLLNFSTKHSNINFKDEFLVFENLTISFISTDVSREECRFVFSPVRNFSIVINPKEHIGIFGRTGCGKTSLIKAILGIIKPSSGRIIFNGIEVSNIPRSERRKIFGVVTQTNSIFENWSIRKYLDPYNEFSDEQIMDSLKLTNLTKCINNLNEYSYLYSTNISKIISKDLFGDIVLKYLNFSRLILNRNSYKLVLLDEPSSFQSYSKLNRSCFNHYPPIPNTKSQIQELCPIEDLLSLYFKHCSVIIVSHNPFIFKHCDRIIKLVS